MDITSLVKWRDVVIGVLLGLAALLMVIVAMVTVPFAYDKVWGKEVIENVAEEIMEEGSTESVPFRIMEWEREYFDSPYANYDPDSFLSRFGITRIDDEYRFFLRGPPSWTIRNKLANCGEYASVFVALTNATGIKSRVIEVPGEDHVFAEYYTSTGAKRIVDPSINQLITDPKEFARGKNWSYIVAINHNGSKEDVSSEYVDRGRLIVLVENKGSPVNNATVTVYSRYLMETIPDRYEKGGPRKVTTNLTDANGTSTFNLGEKNYTVKVKKRFLRLFNVEKGERTVDVRANETAIIDFDVSGFTAEEAAFIGLISISAILGFYLGYYLLPEKIRRR